MTDFLREHEHAVNTIVYDAVGRFGGSISAEHGIGALKRDELAGTQVARRARPDARDQAALDPRGLMNPESGGVADGAGGGLSRSREPASTRCIACRDGRRPTHDPACFSRAEPHRSPSPAAATRPRFAATRQSPPWR